MHSIPDRYFLTQCISEKTVHLIFNKRNYKQNLYPPMKKTTTLFPALIGLFSLLFIWSVPANAQEEEQGIKLTRFINPPVITPGSTVTVNVFVDKGYRGGVARLDESIPSGFSALETDDNGARFYINSDTSLHFAWESMPSDPGFTVSYRLKIPATALGNYTLTAQFIYVTSAGAIAAYFKPYTITVQNPSNPPVAANSTPALPNKAKDTIVAAIAQPVQQSAPAAVIITPNSPVESVRKVDSIPSKPIETKAPVAVAVNNTTPIAHPAIVVQKPAAIPKANIPPAGPKVDTSSKRNGLYYRVQIMASAQRLEVDSVIINGIRDKLYIITTNGISRYYIGAFHELQPAIEYRNRIIGNGLKGPFVVAYKDGHKITIKEALQVVATN